MPVARPSETIVDRTPLTTGRVDVGSRIGWLLRSHRVLAGVGLASMSRRLADVGVPRGVSALSGLERRGDRNGRIIDGYEQALELAPGSLRAPIDMLCRNLRDAPVDDEPSTPPPVDLREFDAVVEPLWSGSPSGGEWLRWARVLASAGRWGLPTRVVEPLVAELLHEMVRSVGPAFATRYVALTTLRRSDYGGVVEDAVRSLVATPGTEPFAVNALTIAVEEPTPQVVAWVASLLSHPSEWVVTGASYSLQTLRVVDALDEETWAVVGREVVRAHRAATGGSATSRALTTLLRTLPATERREVQQRLDRPVDAVPGPASWTADETNVHYATCVDLAARAVERTGGEAQPMLARLFFEAVYDFRTPVSEIGAKSLMASPYILAAQDCLMELALEADDAASRQGAVRALVRCQVPGREQQVEEWLPRVDTDAVPAAFTVAANAGIAVPDAHLAAVDGPDEDVSLRVLEWVGMAGGPALAGLVETATRPVVRAGARWWLDHPGRVVL
ncbi:MAG: hypothetical protein CMH83_12760 [Nocardioides sp.]|nr:hypothetical protein [Nocardioides sp.]